MNTLMKQETKNLNHLRLMQLKYCLHDILLKDIKITLYYYGESLKNKYVIMIFRSKWFSVITMRLNP